MLEALSHNMVRNSEVSTPHTDDNLLLSSIVVRTDENLSCDLQGEAVVLNLKSGVYFGLNPLGARIWELIQEPSKVSDVHQQLVREYEVDANECEEDLLSFLNQLKAQNLIRIQGSSDN